MFAALILVMSIVAFLQFALNYWRAILAGATSQPVSQEVRDAARVKSANIGGQDFNALSEIHHIASGGTVGLGFVRLYYRIVDAIDAVVEKRMPAMAAWTERERAICAHYVAVQIDQRLQANRELAASAHSY
jgi:hypothetical protein